MSTVRPANLATQTGSVKIYRKKIIAGNWKMNKSTGEAKILVEDIIRDIGKFDEAEIVLCPTLRWRR